jgi:hypothetical protein
VRLAVEELESRTLLSFGPPVPVADLDPFPAAVAAGDLDRDGLPDLVVGYVKGDHVTVLLNNGAGPFRNAGNFPTAFDPVSLVVADFNGDGIPDVATAGSVAEAGSVLPGNGDGTFQEPVPFRTGLSEITDLQAGDFNGDGAPDLVAVFGGFDVAQANLLLGVGDGTFEAPRPILTHPSSFSETAAVGDFNGDGNLDVALTEASGDSSQVTVLLGHGDGTFGDPVAYATHGGNTSIRGVVAADLNGDGALDLAVTGVAGVDVLPGRGDGTFGKAALNPLSPGVGRLLATDLNQDGAPDLITSPFSTSGVGNFLLGNGDGTFRPAERYEAGPQHVGLAVADFNGDGFPDLAVVGQEGRAFIVPNQADWPPAPGGPSAARQERFAPEGQAFAGVPEFKEGPLPAAGTRLAAPAEAPAQAPPAEAARQPLAAPADAVFAALPGEGSKATFPRLDRPRAMPDAWGDDRLAVRASAALFRDPV